MQFLTTIPLWAAALLIFCLRIVDVSFSTLRTIAVVQGRIKLSIFLGFFETFIWLTAAGQALVAFKGSWLMPVAYSAGFAAGSAVGIQIDRAIAMGIVVVRMFSSQAGAAIAEALRRQKWKPTLFQGHGADGPNTLIYVICPRRNASKLLETAQSIDPHVYYSVDLVREYYGGTTDPLATPVGWRAILKKK